MTCETTTLANGMRAIICHRRHARRFCKCGARATLLCDFPLPRDGLGRHRGKTCDKSLCEACAVSVGPDRDHCPDHPAAPQPAPVPAQLTLEGL